MASDDYFELGWVTRPRSFKGEVIAYLDTDHPEDYLEMESVFVEINGNLIPFFIDFIQQQKQKHFRIKFEDVDTEEQARSLVKCKLYLPQEILPELDEQDFYLHEVIGYTITDVNDGELGELKEIVENKTNPLFQIEHSSGAEILVPMSDDFIRNIDKENKLITVECPEGLIDLYLS